MKTIKSSPPKLYIADRKLRSSMVEMIQKIDSLGLIPSETAIIAIGRGGFVPAQFAAYALGITDLFSIQSSLYNDEDLRKQTHHISGIYNIPYEEFKNILVIDDLIDSGISMDNVIEILKDTAQVLVNDSFNDKIPTFIPCVVYTQKKKKIMNKKNIIWGRKIKKIDGEKPWLCFPWNDLSPDDIEYEGRKV